MTRHVAVVATFASVKQLFHVKMNLNAESVPRMTHPEGVNMRSSCAGSPGSAALPTLPPPHSSTGP
jgi:hypothetical protein